MPRCFVVAFQDAAYQDPLAHSSLENHMSKKQKFNIAALIEDQMLQSLLAEAKDNLQHDGGKHETAICVVQVHCDMLLGTGVALKAENDITEPLRDALTKWAALGTGDVNSDDYAYITVTFVDGARVGSATKPELALGNYLE